MSLRRTRLGVYILEGDICLSRWIDQQDRLDVQTNLAEIAQYAHFIPEGGVVINAGACLGDHALVYSQLVGGDGLVHAFEPHPETYAALRLNMARLRNVATYNIALSDAADVLRFARDARNIGASHVAPDGDVEVGAVTLDEYLLPHVDRVDFVHLDAEGLEPRILHGARRLLERFHPAIVLEVCDKHLRRAGSSEDALLALLADLGYRILPDPIHAEPELRDILAVWGR